MDLIKFQKFIDEQDLFLKKIKTSSATEKERIFSRTIKVSEEFGELCDEILSSFGDQRDSKLSTKKQDNLGNEFADIIITVFLLAKSLDIDIPKALERKIDIIKQKHNKEYAK